MFKCNDYNQSATAEKSSINKHVKKPYSNNNSNPKSKRKMNHAESENTEEGLRLINFIRIKQYLVTTIDGDIKSDGEFTAVFYCYDDKSNDYGNGYVIKTANPILKTEILNLYRGD